MGDEPPARRDPHRGRLSAVSVVDVDHAERLLDAAEARIAEHGLPPDVVLAAALEELATAWVDDTRPYCGACGKRRIAAGHSFCGECEALADRKREHKRTWWSSHGGEWRARRESVARGEPDDDESVLPEA